MIIWSRSPVSDSRCHFTVLSQWRTFGPCLFHLFICSSVHLFKYKITPILATWKTFQISLFASQFSLAMLNIQRKTDEVGYNILFLEQKCKLILYSYCFCLMIYCCTGLFEDIENVSSLNFNTTYCISWSLKMHVFTSYFSIPT